MIAERLPPESQSGFRKGRGCCDMIFVARQLLEKTREHQESLFTLFVDLRRHVTLCSERHCGGYWRGVEYSLGCYRL